MMMEVLERKICSRISSSGQCLKGSRTMDTRSWLDVDMAIGYWRWLTTFDAGGKLMGKRMGN
jgi:hypothetical protein